MRFLVGWPPQNAAAGDHDRPACKGPTIRDDVLSHATGVSGGDHPAPVSAAVPTAPHAEELAVKPCGISTNRIADAAIAAKERTDRSSPDGRREIFSQTPLGAGPRPALQQSLAAFLVADGPAGDIGDSADDGTGGHPPSSARSGWHANTAIAWLTVDTPDCNTAIGDTEAERTARTLSTGSGAASALGKSLAPEKIVDHAQVDPRESPLPKVTSRRGVLLLSGTLYTRRLILGVLPLPE
jgi:hypothetical protein